MWAAIGVAPAQGATVEGRYYEDIRDEYGSVTVDDPKGQRNDLRIYRAEGRIVVRERGRRALYARGNCRRDARRVVSCPGVNDDRLTVHARAGSDAVRLDTNVFYQARLRGGPGHDRLDSRANSTLDGGSGRDLLLGSRYSDKLYGGSNRDRLHAGRGRDVLLGDDTQDARGRQRSAKPAQDVLDGGRGPDAAAWKLRTPPVRVDLRRQVGGATGEHDELRSIESAVGGRGDDTLLGNGKRNRLLGGPGRDRLVGRAGNDHLDGGGNRRAFDDPYTVSHADRDSDLISCGPGEADHVRGFGVQHPRKRRTDPLPQSCERIRWGYVSETSVPRLHLGAESVRVPLDCNLRFCDWTVTLRSEGDELGRSNPPTFERRRTVTVRLDEPLRRGPPIRIVFDGESRDSRNGRTHEYHFEYRLRRPS